MTFLRAVLFLFWFGRRDLWEKHARRASRSVVWTVAMVVGFVLVVSGLSMGFKKARYLRLQDEPRAAYLGIGSRLSPNEITPNRLEALSSEIHAVAPGAECYPYYRVFASWRVNVDGRELDVPCKGRTLAVGDRIAQSGRLFRTGGPFQSGEAPGIIVAPNMLVTLGLDPLGDYEELSFVPSSGYDPISVPVVGIISDDFPDGYGFLINEAYIEILAGVKPPRNIRTGRIPDEWGQWRNVPGMREAIEAVFKERRIKLIPEVQEQFDGLGSSWWTWGLECTDDFGMPQHDWRKALQAFLDYLEARGGKRVSSDERAQFLKIDAPNRTSRIRREAYDRVAAYVNDLSDWERIAKISSVTGIQGKQDDNEDSGGIEAATWVPLPIDEDLIKQVTAIERTSRIINWVLATISVVVVLVAVGNTNTILVLRSEAKVAEIGMLKAIGAEPQLLGWLYVVQGIQIWFWGMLYGVLGAGGSVWLFVWTCNHANRGTVIAFVCPWWLLVSVVVGSAIVCTLISFQATRKTRRTHPAASLGSS